MSELENARGHKARPDLEAEHVGVVRAGHAGDRGARRAQHRPAVVRRARRRPRVPAPRPRRAQLPAVLRSLGVRGAGPGVGPARPAQPISDEHGGHVTWSPPITAHLMTPRSLSADLERMILIFLLT